MPDSTKAADANGKYMRDAEIAEAPNAAARGRLIAKLKESPEGSRRKTGS